MSAQLEAYQTSRVSPPTLEDRKAAALQRMKDAAIALQRAKDAAAAVAAAELTCRMDGEDPDTCPVVAVLQRGRDQAEARLAELKGTP